MTRRITARALPANQDGCHRGTEPPRHREAVGVHGIHSPSVSLCLCASVIGQPRSPVESSRRSTAFAPGQTRISSVVLCLSAILLAAVCLPALAEPNEEAERSDLDRPVEELFATDCEHKVKTFECAECRYENGVVCAPARLFEGGLMKKLRAERRRLDTPLDLTGEVQFDERRVAHVSSQAEGLIRKVHVTLGEVVRAGQAMVELDSVAVGEAEAAYLEAQGMMELARRDAERLSGLRGVASEKEVFLAQKERDLAGIRLEGALGKLVRLGMSADEARARSRSTARGRLVLRAPADGSVLEMHAVPGEVAKSEASLVTLGDNASVWVWADLYERDVAAISSAQASGKLTAAVTVRAYPGEEFAAAVDFISPSMSPATRTVKLRLATPNPGRRLLAGMFAQVQVFLPAKSAGLTVPAAAVLEDEGRSFVFLHHRGDYYVRRPVTVGQAAGGRIAILSGLSEGAIVVSDGAFLMKSDVLRSKMGAGCAE